MTVLLPVSPIVPRTMRDPAVRQTRRAFLTMPHIAPLTEYVLGLRRRGNADYPFFDPFDGGIEASVLFLFEKPGAMTSATLNEHGSGFISRDNDDPTAEATFHFMEEACIPRRSTITWNVVPGWDGNRGCNSAELRDGIIELRNVLMLLPHLQAIVLVGRKAARATALVEDYRVFTSDHPSPLVRARYPERWRKIPEAWAEVAPLLGPERKQL